MSLNLNKVIISGRLTADPELKATQNGVSVTSFTVAVNRKVKAEGQQTADFINCTAWRGTAEFICRYFQKGSAICIVGAIQTRSWTDQQGAKRYATEILADEANFVENKEDDGERQMQQIKEPAFENISTDQDLPF